MDSPRGRKVFRFDMSLMERLSRSGLSMSQLDVQRRMRPSISSLIRYELTIPCQRLILMGIRNTLYPQLQDHDRVKGYPRVRGLASDIFFLDHMHKEAEESASKYNSYEACLLFSLLVKT
jgi:hypothetical protein